MTMNIRTYFISTLLLIAVSSPLAMGQVVYLITATDDSYTSDGTNTWNALNEAALDTLNTDTDLFDTSNSNAAGLVWTVTTEPAREMIMTGNSGTTWPALSWFSDVDAQTSYANVDNRGAGGQWTISGFNSTDVINIQWIANHHQTNNVRAMDATINGDFSNVIAGNAVSSDEFLTQSGKDQYMEWSGLTPNASGELVFDYTVGSTGNAFYSALTAMRIEVIAVPEPSTFTLMGIGMMGLYFLRRRPRG
jgi:hypothetical protein